MVKKTNIFLAITFAFLFIWTGSLADVGETHELRRKREALLQQAADSASLSAYREIIATDEALLESYGETIDRLTVNARERERIHKEQKLVSGLFFLLLFLCFCTILVINARIRREQDVTVYYRNLWTDCRNFFLYPIKVVSGQRMDLSSAIIIFSLIMMLGSMIMQLVLVI